MPVYAFQLVCSNTVEALLTVNGMGKKQMLDTFVKSVNVKGELINLPYCRRKRTEGRQALSNRFRRKTTLTMIIRLKTKAPKTSKMNSLQQSNIPDPTT